MQIPKLIPARWLYKSLHCYIARVLGPVSNNGPLTTRLRKRSINRSLQDHTLLRRGHDKEVIPADLHDLRPPDNSFIIADVTQSTLSTKDARDRSWLASTEGIAQKYDRFCQIAHLDHHATVDVMRRSFYSSCSVQQVRRSPDPR